MFHRSIWKDTQVQLPTRLRDLKSEDDHKNSKLLELSDTSASRKSANLFSSASQLFGQYMMTWMGRRAEDEKLVMSIMSRKNAGVDHMTTSAELRHPPPAARPIFGSQDGGLKTE